MPAERPPGTEWSLWECIFQYGKLKINMNLECPKLRSDLVVIQQNSAGTGAFVMKDPATGRFFRFKEVEGFILQQLDGKTSLPTLVERAEQKFQAALAQDTLEEFIIRVHNLGLLEESRTTQALQRRPRRIRGDPFYLRIKIFDPDLLFERLSTNLRFFFTRTFLVISVVAIVLALSITLTQWVDIQREVFGLFQFFSLLSAYFIVLVVITAHEFAHGLMCKRFGGQVHEVGFLLLYFMPAFYCDVSDAWLLPEKSKRLWVTFAGGYFEIFLWSLSTITWRLTEPHTLVNNTALVVMATSGIKTLFNFNPLIKLDGYYLLSDYLEIPNLRWRAFGYLKDSIRTLFGSAIRCIQETTRRERRVYLVYGLLAAAFSYWLVATFVFHLGDFLMSQYRGWGSVVFLFFLGGLFRNRLRTLLGQPLAWFRTAGENFTPLKRLLKISIVLAVLAGGLFFLHLELMVSGEFTILPVHNADVRAEVEEIITNVFVDEGDTVHQGDPIVQLSDRALNAELQKTKSELEEIRAKLKLLRAGPRPEEVKLAKTRVAKAEERLHFAEKNLERNQTLFERELLSQKELEQSQELVSIREKELEEEKSNLNILLAGSRLEEIEALEAGLQALTVQAHYLETQLQLLTIRSPASGVITTPKLKEKIGQHVTKGDFIAKVHEMKTVTVEISVSEKDIAEVRMGQPVVVKARAYPQLSFLGSVASIAPVAMQEDQGRQERTIVVRANLDNSQMLLKPGMSGHAKIYCGQHPILNLLIRRILHFIRVEVWSWW